MQTLVTVFEDLDNDRYVFVCYKDGDVDGINFWQGLDGLESIGVNADMMAPCKNLTQWYHSVTEMYPNKSLKDRINLAIRDYIDYVKQSV